MMSKWSMLVDHFFDGFGPGGLFIQTPRPGAPTQLFADEPDGDKGYKMMTFTEAELNAIWELPPDSASEHGVDIVDIPGLDGLNACGSRHDVMQTIMFQAISTYSDHNDEPLLPSYSRSRSSMDAEWGRWQ